MRFRREEGFTLVELAVALGLFALVLSSMALAFDGALSATGRTRFDQQAKALAQEQLEEVRALPVYVSQNTNPNDVDVLDRYFPNLDPPGYDGAEGVWAYTTTETPLTPTGTLEFTRTTTVQFVIASDDGSVTPVEPLPGYNSDDPDLDGPPSDSLNVTVRVSWTGGQGTRTVELDTIVTTTRQEEPKVEASGSILALEVSGLTFRDGDDGGVDAEVLAKAGEASLEFREVTDATAQAAADAVEVAEREPVTNEPLQGGPSAGQASASVPNAATGTTQVDSDSLPAGNLTTLNEPFVVLGSWGETSPATSAEARISATHTQNPEARATVAAQDLVLNARDFGEPAPITALRVGALGGEIEERSTTTSARVSGSVDLASVEVWGSRDFGATPAYEGTVLIDSIGTQASSEAGSGSADTSVSWEVVNLRIWDPDADDGAGNYVGPWTFGFSSVCGGWVGSEPAPGDPECGESFENPNPVVIPPAYVGTDAEGNETTSLSITTGSTLEDSFSDASQGVANAQAAQRGALSIGTRDDITGAAVLEPMTVSVGDVSTTVTYIGHEH